MCAFNDPLSQIHSPATILAWKFCFVRFWKVGTDVQTTSAKMVITTGRDCGSASWINIQYAQKYYSNNAILFLNYTKWYAVICRVVQQYLSYEHGLWVKSRLNPTRSGISVVLLSGGKVIGLLVKVSKMKGEISPETEEK